MSAALFQVLALGALATTAAVAQNTTSPAPENAEINGFYTPHPVLYECKQYINFNWDNVKYACSWQHDNYGIYDNLFFMTFNNAYYKECHCNRGLESWGPWGSRWTWSQDNEVRCYSRDGSSARDVRGYFDNESCPPVVIK